MVALPILAPSPCATCRGPCCSGRNVALSAYDLCRLTDAFGAPWQELAALGVAHSSGFRLDPGATRWSFRLRQRASGACLFAVGGEFVRCGAHAVRPAACRLYPMNVVLTVAGPVVALGNDARCPPDEAAGWSELAAPELVEAELAEHARWRALIERWEATLDRRRAPEELLEMARQ